MSFDVDTRPLTATARVLREGSRIIDDVAEAFVDDLAPDAERAVKARAHRHRRTGALEAEIGTVRQGAGADRRARVRVGGDIAPIIVGGSRPHTITARSRRALSYELRGARSFAGTVHHPGTAPDPFVDRALDDLGGAVDAGLSAAGDRVADGFADEIRRRS